jgi:glycosyltransferase involved in cell wall biosynthesis
LYHRQPVSPAGPAISVVVPTRDRAERLGGLLRSLREQTLDASRFEVIVVDDASDDGTPALLERETRRGGLDLRVVRSESPGGPAVARNAGWPKARAPLVAFIDDDCEASPGWLEAGLDAARAHRGAVVQGRTEPLPRERHRLGPFAHTKSVHGPTPWFTTCNILYPRQVLESVGGFDERFTQAGEDVDLGWRAMEKGAGHEFAAEALAYHGVDDLGPLGDLRMALRGADSTRFYRRHPELRAKFAYGWFFRRPSHAQLILAVAGLAVSRHSKPALLLVLPYARALAGRCREAGASPALVPYFVLWDALHVSTAVRGSFRYRILLL